MLPLILGGLGAALGAVRGVQANQRAQDLEDQTRKMRVAQIKNSPWTGRTSFENIQFAPGQSDVLAGAMGGLQGGAGGMAAGQGLEAGMGGGAKPPVGAAKMAGDASGPMVSQNYADAFGSLDAGGGPQQTPNMYQSPWAKMQMQRQQPDLGSV